MQSKNEKIILTVLTAVVLVSTLQALIYILNLNQPQLFLLTSYAVYFYLVFKILFFYDLHFRLRPQSNLALNIKAIGQEYERGFVSRFKHFWNMKQLGFGFNQLLLPTFIFWSTVVVLYINFGFVKMQQSVAMFSAAALIILYWYVKETFNRQKEKIDPDLFVRMTVIKIYAAGVTYAAGLALMRRYCLSPNYFAAFVFGVTFSLIFYALFQHRANTAKNLYINMGISVVQGVVGYFVYKYWGLNFYTAAVFLVVIYNLLWGVFHYYLDRALSWKVFWEIFLLSVLMAVMLLGATNFRARLINAC